MKKRLIFSLLTLMFVPVWLTLTLFREAEVHAQGGRTYTTNFPLNENPISEGGNWINGRAMRTSGGLAFGTQSGAGGPPYDDSLAVLSGVWGPDQTAQGTVRTVNQQTGNIYQEVLLNVRMTITPTTIAGFNVCFRATHDGQQYVELGYFAGSPFAIGGGTLFAQVRNSAAPGLYDGDVIKLTAIGNVITVYHNNNQILQITDTTHSKAGSPGMGQWLRGPVGTIADYGFTSFTASDGPPLPPTAPAAPTNVRIIKSAGLLRSPFAGLLPLAPLP